MRTVTLSLAAGIASLAIIPGTPAFAQRTGLEDMVGARAGQAENELGRRGYRFIRADQGDDRSYTYWWSDARRQCVTIATMEGRYNSITPTPAPDCRQAASVRPLPSPSYGYQPARPSRPGNEPDPAFSQPPPLIEGQAVQLGLVCYGDGTRAGITSGTEWRWNSRRERYERENYNATTTEMFDTSLMVQLWQGGGRIRLPKALIPPLNSRGENGWWQLRDVQMGPTMIYATYRLNGLNRPRVTIDRRSGRIEVQGTANYSFRGTCDQIGNGYRRF